MVWIWICLFIIKIVFVFRVSYPFIYHLRQFSKYMPLIEPPRIALTTLCSKSRRLFWRTSAASLLSASSAFGSYTTTTITKQFVEFVKMWCKQKIPLSITRSIVTHRKQILQTINDRIDGENGFPVFSQDVQAYVSIKIDIRMIHFRLAFDLWGLVRVIWADLRKQRQQKMIN